MLGASHITTPSYNPKTNGIVERSHRSLKAALRCSGGSWTTSLPVVLLSLRSAQRDHEEISCAEMTYGTSLRLPGEFYTNNEEMTDTFSYVQQLRKAIRAVRPADQTRAKRKQSIFIHPDLSSAEYVFLRVDRVKRPLEPPYQGPFKVIKRAAKWFRIEVNGKMEDVSIDRIKPAYIQANKPI